VGWPRERGVSVKILITGICGFAGSALARSLMERMENLSIVGIDNLMRPGSETNRRGLKRLGVSVVHGDIRNSSDFESLPKVDWVIDAAANPSVLAGLNGAGTSRQLFEHNLGSLVNVLEYCKAGSAGLLLLSSSRVYSIKALAGLPLKVEDQAFCLDCSKALPRGVSASGIETDFSTEPPISLYGSTKLASETLALEYGSAFGFPVWINRCGVLAGAGQFGVPDQGIFSYWINAHLRRRPMRYLGFEGMGYQVRDALHPRDLAALAHSQMSRARVGENRLYSVGGGPGNAISLAQLTAWCDTRFGTHRPEADAGPRRYDIPWMIMASTRATADFGWQCTVGLDQILDEIACHAEQNPDWLEVSGL
jgi:CDP-paratose 2-epimerase